MFSFYHVTVPLPEAETPLLDDISFEIDDGSWAEIVGPSGSGKSVLYSFLALEARPSEGRLVVNGRNLDRVDRSGYAEMRRQFGTCRQSPVFLEERSTVENLVLPLVVRGESGRAGERSEEFLERAGLADRRDVEATHLSEGERALLGVLRAAIGAPEVIVADGVFAQLDGEHRGAARAVLEEAHDRGSTVVLLGRDPSGAGPADPVSFELREGAMRRMDG